MKTCYKCKEEKPFSEFNKNRTKKDGYKNECKVCVKEYNKSYYKKNIEKEKERSRKYKQENKEKVMERKRKHYQENKDHYIEYSRKYYQENKEKVLERCHKYKQENKDLIRKHYKNLPAGVYKITNTTNGKIYVGESTGYKSRFWSHKSALKRGIHKNPGLQTDYDQHSLDIFDFQVIEEHPPDADKKLLLERERYFINKYKEEGKELYNDR